MIAARSACNKKHDAENQICCSLFFLCFSLSSVNGKRLISNSSDTFRRDDAPSGRHCTFILLSSLFLFLNRIQVIILVVETSRKVQYNSFVFCSGPKRAEAGMKIIQKRRVSMKTVKKAIAMLLAVLMVGALSCTAWADQADEVTFDNLESFREDSNVTIDMEMSILGESQVMQMKMKTASDVTLDPECSFTDMSAESDGETQHSLVYSVKEDSKYVIYTSNDEGATWEKQELEENASANESIPTVDGLKMIAGYTEKFEKTGTDEIHGRKADIYEGVLAGDEFKEFLMKAGSLGTLVESFGIPVEDLDSSFVSELPMKVALDQQTGMVLGYSADMGGFMQKMMEAMMSAVIASSLQGEEMPADFDLSAFLSIKVNEVKSECVFYDFNQVEAIQMPKAA